jgi:flavin-dependent dehydrogenase
MLDALIIGGGPSGATAALLLARAGWAVRVLERTPFPRRKVCGEYLSATNLPLLDRLGVGAAFRDLAGPVVRRVGLFAGDARLHADLPPLGRRRPEWGRALAREHLDTLLLDAARAAGAEVWQPWAVRAVWQDAAAAGCQVRSSSGATRDLAARVVLAAHGSWDAGTLPTQPPRRPPAPHDLLGFKAHFTGADLPDGLMPLLTFPGGYGGMAPCDGGRGSLSCCVRRDRLAEVRANFGGDAGDAVLAHIAASCRGVRETLAGATRAGAWLAAGPIRPGVRLARRGRVFPVGNAAGEAHPVIAEGISIAIQSSWLLCERLIAWRARGAAARELEAVGRDYAAAWRRAFAPRLATAELLAQWSCRPTAVAGVLPALRRFPSALAWFARLSGKARRVVPA